MSKFSTIKAFKCKKNTYPLFFCKLIWVGVFVLIQILFIIFAYIKLHERYFEIQTILAFLSICVVIHVINRPIIPEYKLAWSVTILFIPIFGGLFYILLSANTYRRHFRNHIRKCVERSKNHLSQDKTILEHIQSRNCHSLPHAKYIYTLTQYPVYENTYVEYFSSGESMYTAMLRELQQAKHFIFLEYFIIHEGTFWDTILSILKKKAMEGVDIRIIYDDMGCIHTLPSKYSTTLKKYGIQCYAFNPFRPILSLRLNNRDHRKILVIDGYTSFNGGINLADEYINQLNMNGYWKDTGIMLKGEATWNFTNMFLQLWQYLTSDNVLYENYHIPLSKFPKNLPSNTNGFVQPYGDNPLFSGIVAENVYLNMIQRATSYIYITTPYLIIDHKMISALTLAAQSGIDVRIITPGTPDKRTVFMMTRSFYEPLLKAGVKIYEYTPGFIHAKMMLSDDNYAIVGSVNMDFRSLYLHFECATFLYHCSAIKEIKADIEDTISQSKEITYSYCQNMNHPYRLWQSLLRLYAPLL